MARVIVDGVKTKEQTANKHYECDSCSHPIVRGNRYARVIYEKTGAVEMFHPACFREEFTDDDPKRQR